MLGRFFQSSAAAVLISGAVIVPARAVLVSASPTGPISPATTYVYQTSTNVPAASGTLYFSGRTNSDGGICNPNSVSTGSPCPSYSFTGTALHAGPLYSGGATTSGTIEIMTPAAPYPANYALVVTLNANVGSVTSAGDIYSLLVDGQTAYAGTYSNGGCVGGSNGGSTTSTTPVNSTTANGTGTFCAIVQASAAPEAVFIDVTDLAEQWHGSTSYNLPSLLGGTQSSGNAPPYTLSTFSLVANFALAPEPASLSVLAAGAGLLGFTRRRTRVRPAKAP